MQLHKNNIEEFILLSIDGELDTEQEKILQKYLVVNTDAQNLYNSYVTAKLNIQNTEIVFPQKLNLLAIANNQVPKIVAQNKNKNKTWYAIAASICIIMCAYSVIKLMQIDKAIDRKIVAQNTATNSNSKEIEDAQVPTNNASLIIEKPKNVKEIKKQKTINNTPQIIKNNIASSKNKSTNQNKNTVEPIINTKKPKKINNNIIPQQATQNNNYYVINQVPKLNLSIKKTDLQAPIASNILPTSKILVPNIILKNNNISTSSDLTTFSNDKFINKLLSIRKKIKDNKKELTELVHLKKEDVELVIELPNIFNKPKM